MPMQPNPIDALKDLFLTLHTSNITSMTTLCEKHPDLTRELWMALDGFSSLALRTHSHRLKNGNIVRGNYERLAAIGLTPDLVQDKLLIHLREQADHYLALPPSQIVRYLFATCANFVTSCSRYAKARPEQLTLDQPLTLDSPLSLIDTIADEGADIERPLMQQAEDAELLCRARVVLLRVLELMNRNPTAATVLLSRMMQETPLELVHDLRSKGVCGTTNDLLAQLCPAADVTYDEVRRIARPDWKAMRSGFHLERSDKAVAGRISRLSYSYRRVLTPPEP